MDFLMMLADTVDGEPLKAVDYIARSEIVRLRVFKEQRVIEVELKNGERSIYQFASGGAFGATWDDIRGIEEETQ